MSNENLIPPGPIFTSHCAVQSKLDDDGGEGDDDDGKLNFKCLIDQYSNLLCIYAQCSPPMLSRPSFAEGWILLSQ